MTMLLFMMPQQEYSSLRLYNRRMKRAADFIMTQVRVMEIDRLHVFMQLGNPGPAEPAKGIALGCESGDEIGNCIRDEVFDVAL